MKASETRTSRRPRRLVLQVGLSLAAAIAFQPRSARLRLGGGALRPDNAGESIAGTPSRSDVTANEGTWTACRRCRSPIAGCAVRPTVVP